MEINDADVAELVDARDLKSLAATDIAQPSCKTPASAPVETAANPAHLQNNSVGARTLRLAELVQRKPLSAEAVAGQQVLDAIMAEIDRRLSDAMFQAGRSALGMPSSVDTFKAWLYANGLMLVLA